jgi:hypothetical protein
MIVGALGGFENCYAFPGGTQQGRVEGGTPTIYKIRSDGEQESDVSELPSFPHARALQALKEAV